MTRRSLIAGSGLLTAACGYRAGSHSDLLPPTIKTIAIPIWGNNTANYRLSERLPGAIAREFISRTRYKVVGTVEEADAILNGNIANYLAFPNVTEPDTGRAVGIQISVIMGVSLTERVSGKTLFARPSVEFRNRYEIAVDQTKYFEESDAAMERLSRDVARTLVSSILEAF